ncbi:MAG: hypothetical protein HOE90_06795 [Bacteriovoracaceae bacterium]|jgi:hypothetical protein|nr:hypothetical protein [Bacteriovoracaceae bacterium]
MITDRDIKVLRFLNEFGFARTSVINDLFFKDRCPSVCSRRLKILFNQKLLMTSKDIRSTENIYRISIDGINILKNFQIDLFPFKKGFPLGTFIHDDYVQRVLLKFCFAGFKQFISEKRMKRKKIFDEHVPDLLILLSSDRHVFIEVELSYKSKKRLKEKLEEIQRYPLNELTIYFCIDEELENRINLVIKENNLRPQNFLTCNLAEFLKDPQAILNRLDKPVPLKEAL